MNHKMLISVTTCFVLSLVFGLSVSSVAGVEPGTNAEAERHYEKAYELRRASDYDGAIAEYEKVIRLSPNSKIAQDAQYWIGQSHFESKRFDAALSAFQGLLEKYPSSSIASSAKQMIEKVQQAKKNRALFEAVNKADVEQVRLLIAEGADVDAKWGDITTKEGERNSETTPLYFAVDSNNMVLVKLLVEAEANVNAGPKWPPLCLAVDKNNTAIAEYLIDHGANVNAPKDWGPLQHAASVSNSIEMAELLIARGANVNAGRYTALHAAINEDHPNIVKLLVAKGANVNAKESRGRTPLHYSVWGDRLEIAKLLLEAEADVNAKDNDGWTPLHYTVFPDKLEIAQLFVEAEADVNARNDEGETPLHFAATRGKTEAAKLLLEAGADVSVKNDKGQTALHKILDTSESIYLGKLQPKDTVELFLTKGADVNSKDKDGRTPWHLAAQSAEGDVVKLLLDKGAKIDAKDDESGFTALHHAARFGNKNAAELLIARGADVNAKDKQGHTPLYVAVNHDHKVAELLMNKGADSDIRTESGQTLLQMAQQRKQTESTVPDMIFDGDPNSWFGYQIVCGDVDGDGYDDILIGAFRYNNDRGRVYLFYGGPDMDTTADLIFEGHNEGDLFGSGLSCGDIDNDGHEDILIGAGLYNKMQGRAYLYWGSDRKSMDAHPDKIFTGEAGISSRFGMGWPTVYDIDNDGYDDIILCAHSGLGHSKGRAYLYYGNTKQLMDTSHDLMFIEENPRDRFGLIIRCGDVDNDGYGDIVIGCTDRKGRKYLYYGDSQLNMNAKADVIF